MSNDEYWNKRANQRFLMGEKTASELLNTMKTVYNNSLKDINKEIEAFYGRYAENNNLTITEVNKRLDPKELKSTKEEIKKYYDKINELARNSDGSVDVKLLRQYKDELLLQSAKAYMSRLEELKLNLKNITVNLGIEESKAYYQTLSKIYDDTYKRVNYDFDKFLGWSTGFEGLNYKKLNSAIHQQWLGENYSDRIWKNKGKLLDQINTTFLQGIAQGHNPRKIAETMSKNMGTSYYNCKRLARTESAHIIGEATLQGYKDRGRKQYQFEATLDNRTSDICQSLDGQVFELREAQEGVNYPPMHPNCRSTTIPYFESDEIDKMFDEAQRVARDENGELYYVPASMTYKEWEKTIGNNNNEKLMKYPLLTDDVKSSVRTRCEQLKIERNPVDLLEKELTEDEIINRLKGGDRTKGSCVSLALAFTANKAGFNVLDYRGGMSQTVFSLQAYNRFENFKGVKIEEISTPKEVDNARNLLNKMLPNKNYLLLTGRHCAVVRKIGGNFEYLEMQRLERPNWKNGWQSFGNTKKEIDKKLRGRFGCVNYRDSYNRISTLIDCETLGKNAEFIKVTEYINTAENKQMKGIGGGEK